MTNMEVATYLGIAGLAINEANKQCIKEGESDKVHEKILEAVRIAQLMFTQKAMEELVETMKEMGEEIPDEGSN